MGLKHDWAVKHAGSLEVHPDLVSQAVQGGAWVLYSFHVVPTWVRSPQMGRWQVSLFPTEHSFCPSSVPQ